MLDFDNKEFRLPYEEVLRENKYVEILGKVWEHKTETMSHRLYLHGVVTLVGGKPPHGSMYETGRLQINPDVMEMLIELFTTNHA